jgi:hypothetical protein
VLIYTEKFYALVSPVSVARLSVHRLAELTWKNGKTSYALKCLCV